MAETASEAAATTGSEPASHPGGHGAGGWRRITVAAALGVLPAVALFALGPTFAAAWLGDRAATGPLYAVVLGGGAVGFVVANARGFRAELAMLLSAVGLAMPGAYFVTAGCSKPR